MNNHGFDYETAWLAIQEMFPILRQSTMNSAPSTISFEETSEIVKTLHLTEHIQHLIISKIQEKLRTEIVPTFWAFFKRFEGEEVGFLKFQKAVEYLYKHFIELEAIAENLEFLRRNNEFCTPVYNNDCMQKAMILILKSGLFSQLPIDHQEIISEFYERVLRIIDPEDHTVPIIHCDVCMESRNCKCSEIFRETNQKLAKMDLLEPLIGQVLTNLIYNYVQSHIQKICKDSFDSSHLEAAEYWLHHTVVGWLQGIYCGSNEKLEYYEEFDKKLKNYFYNTYTKIRIEQLFNIIIEYPDSLPALEDLKTCLPRTDLKGYLSKSLQKAMEARLLHPGVSTSDVLTAYVAAIRSLRVLDPSGLLLETITQPVHHYLRSREDTIRCVVSSLTEEGPNDLAEELVRGEVIQVDENISIEEGVDDWQTWTPDSADGGVASRCPTRNDTIVKPLLFTDKPPGLPRTSDIITMLVNVYGSKDLFVNEYRTLLADRLLSQYSCDTEKEIRYLELLKLRFGDSQLHYCEVMLKDIADSKRINQHIKQDLNYTEENVPMSAMILSAQFWPPFKDEKLELHTRLIKQMESYTSAFETLKGSRTLCWKNHLGIVDLEIELSDRTLNLSVSPVHATILMHFQDYKTWYLDALSKVMQVPSTVLRRKLSFWQSHGVITETEPDRYDLQEEQKRKNSLAQDDIVVEDFESESVMASAQDQREEELQTFWSYILGMLMNLDTLPIERIHQMLKMFAFQGPTIECSLPELKTFLDRKVREHQLIYSNGLYRLPK